MARHRFRSALVAGLATLALVAAGASARAQTKVLKIVPSADLPSLDPVFASVVITRIFGMMVYEELFAWDKNLQPRPEMVDNWSTSPDQLTWRFTLRGGLKFHDGSPVTSADVVASLRRWMTKDIVGQKLGAATTSLDAVDDRTFELKLKQPVSYVLFALGSAIGQVPFIMRAKDLQGLDPGKPLTTAIGSGPVPLQRRCVGQRRPRRIRQEHGLRATERTAGRACRRPRGEGGPRGVARHPRRFDRDKCTSARRG